MTGTFDEDITRRLTAKQAVCNDINPDAPNNLLTSHAPAENRKVFEEVFRQTFPTEWITKFLKTIHSASRYEVLGV